jgi:hypothetical protein
LSANKYEEPCPCCGVIEWSRGREFERERINDIIEQFIENSDYPEVVSSLQWLQDVIKGENK